MDFLMKNKAEVIKVSLYEFDEKKHEDWVRGEGKLDELISLVIKKVKRNKEFSVIIDELESDEEQLRPIYESVLKYGTELPPDKIREKMGC